MRFGAHLFVWTAEVTPDAVARAAREAAEAGLDFLEIPLLREDLPLGEVREVLRSYGLGATCSLGLPREAKLPEYPERAKAYLSKALEMAVKLESSVLTGVIYGTLGESPTGSIPAAGLEVVARTLRTVAREARRLGLKLGIEPVNRYETALINTAKQGLALISEIGEENVFLHLDTYHMNIEEKGFRDPILSAGGQLGYIHLSESDRGTPGSGNVRWDEVFSGLAAIGYRGPLVMESFVAMSPEIARATCIWRPVVEEPGLLVRDGTTFLKQMGIKAGL